MSKDDRRGDDDMSEEKRGEMADWVPTAKEKPKENERYLVTVFFNGETYVDIDDYFCYGWDDYGDAVIAWAELPEPYGEEQK